MQLTYALKALKLPTLQYRRQHGDMITNFKLFHGLIGINPSKLFKNIITKKGNQSKVLFDKCKLDMRKTFIPSTS